MIFETPFTVYTHLSDRFCRLSIPSTAQLFQEAAELHCRATHLGFEELYAQGKVWVLSRVSYRYIGRYPKLDEPIKLRTWSRGYDGLLATRDFEILSAMNEVLIAATSVWVVIDYQSRRVCRMRSAMENFEHHQQSALAIEPVKIVVPSDMETVASFQVPFSAIDKAQHVNNAEYIRWMVDALPADKLQNGISALDVNYLQETRPDETITLLRKQEGAIVWFQIMNSRGVSVNSCVEFNEA